MTSYRLAIILIGIVSLSWASGCCNGRCVKRIDLSPTLTASPTGSLSGQLQTKFEFEDCLTRAEQEIVEEVKAALAVALNEAKSGEITWEDFDEYAIRVTRTLQTLEGIVREETLDGAGFSSSQRAEIAARLLVLSSERPN